MSNFVICERLEPETETEFNSDILKMKINDYYDTRRNSLEITKKKKKNRKLNAILSLKDKQKKRKSRAPMKSYNDGVVHCEKDLRTKMLLEFDHSVGYSIISLAVQKVH